MSWLVTLAGSTRQLITFEGSTHVVMVPEELEELEAKLAAVIAERDELHKDTVRLDWILSQGFDLELGGNRADIDKRMELDARRVAKCAAKELGFALRGEGEQ
jgi:hypothetical protein